MTSAASDFISALTFDDRGLIPAIAQQFDTGEVLMMAWMNRESLELTFAHRRATYFSRSRQELWEKGATSGHTQAVHSIAYDCDQDVVLLQVNQSGPACHTGNHSCFSAHSVTFTDSDAS